MQKVCDNDYSPFWRLIYYRDLSDSPTGQPNFIDNKEPQLGRRWRLAYLSFQKWKQFYNSNSDLSDRAAKYGYEKLVEKILSNPSFNSRDILTRGEFLEDWSPIETALYTNHPQIVKMLLSRLVTDHLISDRLANIWFDTIFYYNYSPEIAEILWPLVTNPNGSENNTLSGAIPKQDDNLVDKLLADPRLNILTFTDGFYEAVRTSDLDLVESFVYHPLMTPDILVNGIQITIFDKNYLVLGYLLEIANSSPQLSFDWSSYNFLQDPIEAGDIGMVQHLVNAGVNVENYADVNLALAIDNGDIEIVASLVIGGLTITFEDIIHAIGNQDLKMTLYLLENAQLSSSNKHKIMQILQEPIYRNLYESLVTEGIDL